MASIKLSLDDLAALDSCGLNYTLDISKLCGNTTITTTSSLTIGGGDDCNSPAITDSSTTHTQHTQKTITYISLPPCPTTNAVGRSSIHNPLYKLKYIGE